MCPRDPKERFSCWCPFKATPKSEFPPKRRATHLVSVAPTPRSSEERKVMIAPYDWRSANPECLRCGCPTFSKREIARSSKLIHVAICPHGFVSPLPRQAAHPPHLTPTPPHLTPTPPLQASDLHGGGLQLRRGLRLRQRLRGAAARGAGVHRLADHDPGQSGGTGRRRAQGWGSTHGPESAPTNGSGRTAWDSGWFGWIGWLGSCIWLGWWATCQPAKQRHQPIQTRKPTTPRMPS